jgi:adenosine deaminase
VFYDPTTFFPQGVSFTTITDGILDGFRAAERDFGIRGRLIAAINRSESAVLARHLLEEVLAHRRDEVIGIGLDNLETSGPPERFVDAYRLAKQAGLHRTAHVAEHDPHARNVVTCLDHLQCDRLDHGYFILQDLAVVARCRDLGIAFTCSFTTSRRSWRAWRRRSIKAMHEAGLKMVLGADDPAMFPTTLAREFEIGRDKVGFDDDTLVRLCLNGVDAAWLDDGEKRALRQEFVRDIARLRAPATESRHAKANA